MPVFVNIGEEGLHRIKIFARVRIVFVIVALGAAHGGAHPHVGKIAHTVGGVNRQILFFLNPSFVRRLQQAVISGGDLLLDRWAAAINRQPTVRE